MLDTQNLRNEIMSMYHPLGLADMSILTVAVHQWLAQPILPVLLWDDSEVIGRPPAAQLVLSLWILNQPIDRTMNVLVLGQVDPMRPCGLHLLLQHIHVVNSNRYQACMYADVLDHLSCSVVEHGADIDLANSVHQAKVFLHVRKN
jgi:hypothetical protein